MPALSCARVQACFREPARNPPGIGDYYKQQLLSIEWSRGSAAAAAGLPINVSAGVGVAGHSMGGQATIFSAAYNGSSHRIQAAVS